MHRPVDIIQPTENNKFFLAFESGDFDWFHLSQRQLFHQYSQRQHEHDKRLTSVNIYAAAYCVTVGQDWAVKVWCIEPKRLLRSIQFNAPVQSACILNSKLDLMVGHENLISLISSSQYLPNGIDVQYDGIPDIGNEPELTLCTDQFMLKIKTEDDRLRSLNFAPEEEPFTDTK